MGVQPKILVNDERKRSDISDVKSKHLLMSVWVIEKWNLCGIACIIVFVWDSMHHHSCVFLILIPTSFLVVCASIVVVSSPGLKLAYYKLLTNKKTSIIVYTNITWASNILTSYSHNLANNVISQVFIGKINLKCTVMYGNISGIKFTRIKNYTRDGRLKLITWKSVKISWKYQSKAHLPRKKLSNAPNYAFKYEWFQKVDREKEKRNWWAQYYYERI